MVPLIVIESMPGVNQLLLTAVCRSSSRDLGTDGEATLQPRRRAAIHVCHLGITNSHQVGCGRVAALPRVADGQHGTIPRNFGNALFELGERDEMRLRHMRLRVFPWLPNIEQKRLRVSRKPPPELDDIDHRDVRGHGAMLVRRPGSLGRKLRGLPASNKAA